MNNILESLLYTCNKLNSTIMKFDLYDTTYEIPKAAIEDSEGRISTIYYEDDCWS